MGIRISFDAVTPEPVREPTYYKAKGVRGRWWNTDLGNWYRIFDAGSCGAATLRYDPSPDERPEDFIPCYDDLVITISRN